jgi:ferric-dicitrate binding protein FerR (iron transport regulator)
MDQEKLQYLFEKYFNKTATEEERAELLGLLKDPTNSQQVLQVMSSTWASFERDSIVGVFTQNEADTILENILTNIPPNGKLVSINRKRFAWWRYTAAAVILVIIVGIWFVADRGYREHTEQTTAIVTKDVEAPNKARAILTLANGTKVYLDSVNNGTIAKESDVDVVKTEDGRIIYSHADTKTQSELVYNTLSNPRGSKVIDMQLSDGSHVWLNAGSSVTYPVAFIGSERMVQITGEAYFEVKHDANRPFHVKKGNTDVTVLGTHFNVNAYDDEDALRITLLEGSVAVKNESNNVRIKPGEQAIVSGDIKVNKDVDVEDVMAWKNGMFQFNRTSIQSIMKQVERWYDVDVEYKTNVSQKDFTGGIARKENVSQVLKMLETTGAIHFNIEGRKVVVMQ